MQMRAVTNAWLQAVNRYLRDVARSQLLAEPVALLVDKAMQAVSGVQPGDCARKDINLARQAEERGHGIQRVHCVTCAAGNAASALFLLTRVWKLTTARCRSHPSQHGRIRLSYPPDPHWSHHRRAYLWWRGIRREREHVHRFALT